jgi:hypothetical protein
MQENCKSLSRCVVLSEDCMLEQFALDVLGQIAPNCRDRSSQRQYERSDPIVTRMLIRAIDEFDRLDDLAGIRLGPFRGRGNQEPA